jgi:hydroxymethylglutaryl-CoA reductase
MSDDKVQTLKVKRSSRLSGFYRQTPESRRTRLVESRWLAPEEAEACAYAARSGVYRPLTSWKTGPAGELVGWLEMPLATSTVGGAARSHPGVQRALKLARVTSAVDLAGVAAAAGLATNLAALKALSTEGIQKGHMALHARRVAAEAGAQGELVEIVAERLARECVYRPERAREILAEEARRKGTVR